MKYGVTKKLIFSITTYPLTRHCSPPAPPVHKVSSFSAMAKECNIFSFDLHSNTLNLHCNGTVFNQRFVISSRIGILHACLSPKWQNLRREYFFFFFFFVFAKRTTIPAWLYGRLNERLNYIAQFWISAIVAKCQPFFIWHPPSALFNLTLISHLRKISLRFSVHNTVLRVWRSATV